MDEVNVAVIAPVLGRDLSFVSDVGPRVRVFDASFAAPGRRAGPGGPAAPVPGRLASVLAQAEVLVVGYPVPQGTSRPAATPTWPRPCGGSSPTTSAGTWTASPSSTWSTAPAGTNGTPYTGQAASPPRLAPLPILGHCLGTHYPFSPA